MLKPLSGEKVLSPVYMGPKNFEGREIMHAQNRNPWTDLDKILHGGIDITDVVTHTNFGDHQLRGF